MSSHPICPACNKCRSSNRKFYYASIHPFSCQCCAAVIWIKADWGSVWVLHGLPKPVCSPWNRPASCHKLIRSTWHPKLATSLSLCVSPLTDWQPSQGRPRPRVIPKLLRLQGQISHTSQYEPTPSLSTNTLIHTIMCTHAHILVNY